MIKTIDCNLLEADVDVIAHCANCFCTMGGGVAYAIAVEYPEAVEADDLTKKGDGKKLGTVSLAVVKDPTKHKNQNIKAIANIYGQYGMGGEKAVNYEGIYNGLVDLKKRLKPTIRNIGLPHKIGCGLAGGDWRIVEKMIEVVFENVPYDVIICKFEPKSFIK